MRLMKERLEEIRKKVSHRHSNDWDEDMSDLFVHIDAVEKDHLQAGNEWIERLGNLVNELEKVTAERDELKLKGEALCREHGNALIQLHQSEEKLKVAEEALGRVYNEGKCTWSDCGKSCGDLVTQALAKIREGRTTGN